MKAVIRWTGWLNDDEFDSSVHFATLEEAREHFDVVVMALYLQEGEGYEYVIDAEYLQSRQHLGIKNMMEELAHAFNGALRYIGAKQ